MSNFSGFACYETTFVLDDQKALILEISSAIRGVEVFMNSEALGIRIKQPCRYDLSSLVWQEKNHLVIEVAVAVETNLLEKIQYDKYITRQPCIIGNIHLYTN
jgi:hypothetical protein